MSEHERLRETIKMLTTALRMVKREAGLTLAQQQLIESAIAIAEEIIKPEGVAA